MKTICFFCGNLNNAGGTERVATSIANALAEKGYNILMLNLWEGDKPFFDLNKKIKSSQLYSQRVSFSDGQLGNNIADDAHKDNRSTRRDIQPIAHGKPKQAVCPTNKNGKKHHPLIVEGEKVGCHLRDGKQTEGQHNAHHAQSCHYGQGYQRHHTIFYPTNGKSL